MEKLIEKLREILAGLGLDENSIEKVVEELSQTAADEVAEENAQSADPVESTEVTEEVSTDTPEAPVEEGEGEPAPVAEPNPVEAAAVEGDPVPPQEAQTAPAPAFDPAPILAKLDELSSDNAELRKALEGSEARVAALEEALTKAGVIDKNDTPVEVGDPLPSADPQSPTEDALGSVLDFLNKKR